MPSLSIFNKTRLIQNDIVILMKYNYDYYHYHYYSPTLTKLVFIVALSFYHSTIMEKIVGTSTILPIPAT